MIHKRKKSDPLKTLCELPTGKIIFKYFWNGVDCHECLSKKDESIWGYEIKSSNPKYLWKNQGRTEKRKNVAQLPIESDIV